MFEVAEIPIGNPRIAGSFCRRDRSKERDLIVIQSAFDHMECGKQHHGCITVELTRPRRLLPLCPFPLSPFAPYVPRYRGSGPTICSMLSLLFTEYDWSRTTTVSGSTLIKM